MVAVNYQPCGSGEEVNKETRQQVSTVTTADIDDVFKRHAWLHRHGWLTWQVWLCFGAVGCLLGR